MTNDEIAAQFGRNVATTRRRVGLSQTALARAAEIDVSTVQKVEYGRRSVRLFTMLALADALGVDPCDLLQGLRP